MTPPIVITVRAPDGPGLVADIAGAVASIGGNIIDVGQHSDQATTGFGCRLEVDPTVDPADLGIRFAEVAQRRHLTFEIHDPEVRPRVVIASSVGSRSVSSTARSSASSRIEPMQPKCPTAMGSP